MAIERVTTGILRRWKQWRCCQLGLEIERLSSEINQLGADLGVMIRERQTLQKDLEGKRE